MVSQISPLKDPDASKLTRLQMLVARAGQNDSLQWWDDNSLTPHGTYLLERVFPAMPAHSGTKLALIAATTRHNVALASFDHATHLYRLRKDRDYQSAIWNLPQNEEPDISDPILDIDALRERLLDMSDRQPAYEIIGMLSQHKGLQIKLLESTTSVVEKALALAWAYSEGEMGHPVFPYIVE